MRPFIGDLRYDVLGFGLGARRAKFLARLVALAALPLSSHEGQESGDNLCDDVGD